MPHITDLPDLIAGLPANGRARFDRLFHVQRIVGRCAIPSTMRVWTEAHFGSVADVETQSVVRVTNRVTWEGALFNPLRTRRPLLIRADADPQPSGHPFDRHTVAAQPADDLFADPLRKTAIDLFGRVTGEHCITTSNIARWDGQCAVLIFDEPNPLSFTPDHFRDYFRASLAWADRAHEADPEARYFVWMWNGGTPGGASIPHAHAQLGLGRYQHYARIEGLRQAAAAYRAASGFEYFADMLAAHDDLGLAFGACGLPGLVYLAPNRGKETWVIGRAFDDQLADAFAFTLQRLIDQASLRAFNVAVQMPPLFGPQSEDWSGFPVLVRMCDRGQRGSVSSDVGAMDFYGQAVVAHDPFQVREAIGIAV